METGRPSPCFVAPLSFFHLFFVHMKRFCPIRIERKLRAEIFALSGLSENPKSWNFDWDFFFYRLARIILRFTQTTNQFWSNPIEKIKLRQNKSGPATKSGQILTLVVIGGLLLYCGCSTFCCIPWVGSRSFRRIFFFAEWKIFYLYLDGRATTPSKRLILTF